MKISLCIPMYNESSIIVATLKTVSEYMRGNFEDYEVLFCDDGSTDNCRAAVEAFGDERIKAVGYGKNRGKGAAVRYGMLLAEGDVIIFTDCDLAYGLDVVKGAVQIFESEPDTDIVIGSRNLTNDGYEGYTLTRRLASKAYIKCVALAAGFKLTDSQCGFKCFRREAAREIFSRCEVDGFAFDLEALIIADNIGAVIREMPVKVVNHRESKVHVLGDSVKMLGDVRRMRKRIKKKGKGTP